MLNNVSLVLSLWWFWFMTDTCMDIGTCKVVFSTENDSTTKITVGYCSIFFGTTSIIFLLRFSLWYSHDYDSLCNQNFTTNYFIDKSLKDEWEKWYHKLAKIYILYGENLTRKYNFSNSMYLKYYRLILSTIFYQFS